jgi:hypothetical protein
MKGSFLVRSVLVSCAALLLLSVGFTAAPVSAATYSITIHARVCPDGQPTTDIFKDCHPYAAAANTRFRIDSGVAKYVAANGNVTFGGQTASKHVVRRIEGLGPDGVNYKQRVWCKPKYGVTKEIIPSTNGNFVLTLTAAGGSVTCDVYLIPIP